MGEMVIAMVCMLIEPLSVMVFAALMWKMPPSFGDMGFSYKTELAQRSPEAWDFAQVHFGKTTFFTHVMILALSAATGAVGIMLKLPENVFAWTVTAMALLQVFAIVGNIIETEHKLKKYFWK